MAEIFQINGYWKDSKEEFKGYIVQSDDSENLDDEQIFYYGLSEEEIKKAIELGEETELEFVIISYNK